MARNAGKKGQKKEGEVTMLFTFGSDPEFMLVDADGNFVSAIGIVPGTKYKPHKIGGNNYYYDNVMAECTVQPGATRDIALANFRNSFLAYATMLAKKNLRMRIQASANFPPAALQNPEALRIGCDREACCYALREMDPPEQEFQANTLRSAGGHLHIGSKWAAGKPLNVLALIRMCDLFLGTMSIFLDKDVTSKERKKLYGKAGRFRMPPHGGEYRALGNFWLASPVLVGFVYDVSEFIMNFLETGKYDALWNVDVAKLNDDSSYEDENFNPANCHQCLGYNPIELRAAIDEMDKQKGKKFLALIERHMPSGLFSQFKKLAASSRKYDFYKEWSLS